MTYRPQFVTKCCFDYFPYIILSGVSSAHWGPPDLQGVFLTICSAPNFSWHVRWAAVPGWVGDSTSIVSQERCDHKRLPGFGFECVTQGLCAGRWAWWKVVRSWEHYLGRQLNHGNTTWAGSDWCSSQCPLALVRMRYFKARYVPSCMQSALFLLLHHDVKPLDILRIPAPCYVDPLGISLAR